jgi:hypothetical protein
LASLRIDVLDARSPLQRVLLIAVASFVFGSSYKTGRKEVEDEEEEEKEKEEEAVAGKEGEGQIVVSEARPSVNAQIVLLYTLTAKLKQHFCLERHHRSAMF